MKTCLILVMCITIGCCGGCNKALTSGQLSEQALTVTLNSKAAAETVVTALRANGKVDDGQWEQVEAIREGVTAACVGWNASLTQSDANTMTYVSIATSGLQTLVQCEVALQNGQPLPAAAVALAAKFRAQKKLAITFDEITVIIEILLQYGIPAAVDIYNDVESLLAGTQQQLDSQLATAWTADLSADNAWLATRPVTAGHARK
jgi:hypothetical protein